MNQIFDFGDVKEREALIRRTWSEFRASLARKEFQYDDTDAALKCTFLKVFDDLHSHIRDKMAIQFSELEAKVLLRGAKLRTGENPDYNRMLPNAKYIKEDNRFSPPGIEWLYFAVGDNVDEAMECSRAECRIKAGDRFGSCQFEIDSNARNYMIADLTVADTISTREINDALEKAGQKYKDKTMRRSLTVGIPVPASPGDVEKMKIEIGLWTFRTYMKTLSGQIFLPLDDADDKSLIYAPFQCLAQYFISKGYAGIVYKSTLSAKGKNLVLFDKSYASPVGNIEIEEP